VFQVLPAYIAKSIGALLTDPFASACMPGLLSSMMPYLDHIQSASAQLLREVDVAAANVKRLDKIMQSSGQVCKVEC